MSKAEVFQAADEYAATDGSPEARNALATIMDRIELQIKALAANLRANAEQNTVMYQNLVRVEGERDRFAHLLLEAVVTFEAKGEMPTLCADARIAMGTPKL